MTVGPDCFTYPVHLLDFTLPMQRNHPGRYPFHIKRGKKVPSSVDAVSYLQQNEKMAELLPTIKRNTSLQKECQQCLPSIFQHCQVLQLVDHCLTIATPNAAFASKLKQNLPKIQSFLVERGWQVNAIRIKVQVNTLPSVQAQKHSRTLSGRALDAFSALEGSLEKTEGNKTLLIAIKQLLRR